MISSESLLRLLSVGVILFSCQLSHGQASKTNVDFYLTPSISKETIAKHGAFISSYLKKETGLEIMLYVPKDYDELVEQFGKDKPCFGMMSSQSYVVANKKYGAQVKLRAVRFGHSVYYGMIVVNSASGFKKLSDLNGKTIAYTDPLSTSGYLYPKKLLARKGVALGKEIMAGKHDEVIRLVYEGKADAGAAFFSPPSSTGDIRDARERLKSTYPDVEKRVTILTKTEPIPNDPIVFSKDFDLNTARKLYTALVKMAIDKEGKQVLLDLYGIEGFAKASDADYNSLRAVVESVR